MNNLICPYSTICDFGINFCSTCSYGRKLDIINHYQMTNNIIFSNEQLLELLSNDKKLEEMKGAK